MAQAAHSAGAPQAEVVSLAELEDLCIKALQTLGYRDDEASIILEVRSKRGKEGRPFARPIFT